MNLDDIEREFWGDQREQPTRVRLARVIRALRDEVRVIHVDQFSMEKLFDEILAGAGEEKVAGDVNPDGARISGLETTAPAASGSPAAGFFVERTPELDAMFDAPAADPSVCVWHLSNEVGALGFRWLIEPPSCGSDFQHEGYAKALDMRCFCGKPIKFLEG